MGLLFCDRNVLIVYLLLFGSVQVPARAAAAAAVARALATLPPDQRESLSSSSEELSAIYGSRSNGPAVEELEEEFYKEVCSWCFSII